MLDRLSGLPLHRFFYITALVLVAIGVCLNKVVMSVGTIMLISSWVLEGEFAIKWQRIKSSKLFWIGISFFLLHIVGLLWTSDFEYAFHDLRAKLPVLVIPFVLGSIPSIGKMEFRLVLFSFISSVIITSIFNILISKGYLSTSHEIHNFRDYSYFISHIRFSLMIDFAIFILVYFSFVDFKKFLVYSPLILWLLYYSYFSQIISGFIYLLILTFLSGVFFAFRSKKIYLKIGVSFISIGLAIGVGIWISSIVKEFQSIPQEQVTNPEDFTVNGNPYTHNIEIDVRENGNLIYLHICDEELEKEWHKRSEIQIDSVLPGMVLPLRFTLIRYMTGLGYKKDSLGISKLSDEDIQNIIHGYTSPVQAKGGIKARVIQLLQDVEEWKLEADPNNKTIFQRLSYWEAGWNIFTSHVIIGVGTGDIQNSFNDYYEKTNSKLHPENRLRSHNQYLSIAVSFGILGLAVFLIFFFYPIYLSPHPMEYLHFIFIILMCLSFIPEDTLETQSGISFFALFYSLFLYRKRSA
ncbi:MAG: O-antigen ligase family protein [Crocinitomicaceae bacterium]|nr:O-antigen ligase family protein [Crocinitomicaceae bacterium]